MTAFEAFTAAYITAAFWSSIDDNGEPLDANYGKTDLAPETLEKITADCAAFYLENQELIHCEGAPQSNDVQGTVTASEAAMAGHDFWLTRCGHGAGFWDGGWPEPAATKLTAASERAGDVDLYVGDDGQVYA